MDGAMDSNISHVDLPGGSGGYNLWEGVDMNVAGGFGNIGEGGGEMSNAVSGGMELPDSSSAWFMPFNMDPPQIGEVDASLFMSIGGAGGGGGAGSFSEHGGVRDVGMTEGQGQP